MFNYDRLFDDDDVKNETSINKKNNEKSRFLINLRL